MDPSTGRLDSAYGGEGRRAALATDDARALHAGSVREETDPLRQALLEISAAVVLATPYNDFNTH